MPAQLQCSHSGALDPENKANTCRNETGEEREKEDREVAVR